MKRLGPGPLIIGVLGAILATSCELVVDEEYCDSDAVCRERARSENVVCDDETRACVPVPRDGCIADRQCTRPERPSCNRETSMCEPCVVPEGGGVAAACSHFRDPPRPFCVRQGAGTRCAECMNNSHCPGARPICDGGECRKCREHRECGPEVACDDSSDTTRKPCRNSWVCIGEDDHEILRDPGLRELGGRCAYNQNMGRVVYARNFPMFCDDKWPGTYNEPLCTIDAAVSRALDHPDRVRYVRLLDTVFPPPSRALTGAALRLAVIGAPASGGGVEVRGDRTLFQVGNGASLLLDQIKLVQERANTTALSCSGAPMPASLTVRRSAVLGSTPAGALGVFPAISSNDCDTAVLFSYVGAMKENDAAHAAGIRLVDSSAERRHRVIGSIIAGNQGPALELLAVTSLTFRFNTVVRNGRPGGFGGVDCGGAALELGESILFGNAPVGMAQTMRGCTLGISSLTEDPKLDTRFHLRPESTACIDKVPAAAGFPDRDIDGEARPQGRAFDIGADELLQ